jgi:hypothetical protein
MTATSEGFDTECEIDPVKKWHRFRELLANDDVIDDILAIFAAATYQIDTTGAMRNAIIALVWKAFGTDNGAFYRHAKRSWDYMATVMSRADNEELDRDE